jgi:hypothetical protein
MNCPHCNAEMEAGVTVAKAKPSLMSMFVGMNGYQHLWFVPVDATNPSAVRAATFNGEGEVLQKVGQPANAFRCANCKTTVISLAN